MPVRFTRADKPSISQQVLFGAGVPSFEGGYGGWTVVPRFRRTSLTEWTGRDPMRALVPIRFDGWREGRSVDKEVASFTAAFSPSAIRDGSEPPPVKVHGAAPISSSTTWVIEDLEWAVVERRADGQMVRVSMIVHLLQYVSGASVVRKSTVPKRAAQKKGTTSHAPAKARTYTVKPGDTLSAIASRLLGSAKRYPEIARLNGIRDPNRIRSGTVLRLPAS